MLFTANDACMRDFEIYVPPDCAAANTDEDHDWSLSEMGKILKADIRPSPRLRTNTLLRNLDR